VFRENNPQRTEEDIGSGYDHTAADQDIADTTRLTSRDGRKRRRDAKGRAKQDSSCNYTLPRTRAMKQS
jgi:hypothetical protein